MGSELDTARRTVSLLYSPSNPCLMKLLILTFISHRSTPAGRPINSISPTLAATIGSSAMGARVHEEQKGGERSGVVHRKVAGRSEDVLAGIGSQFDGA